MRIKLSSTGNIKIIILFSFLVASLVGSILAWKAVINQQQKFDRLEPKAAEGDPIGGLESIKGFSQVIYPANSSGAIKSNQRALSADGKELWQRQGTWNSSTNQFEWPAAWTKNLITDFPAIRDQTQLSQITMFNQVVLPNQISWQRLLSPYMPAPGYQSLWQRSGTWNPSITEFSWENYQERNLFTTPIAGQNGLLKFSQVVHPNNVSWQRALSLDGRYLYQRSGSWNGTDFTWDVWSTRDLQSPPLIANQTALLDFDQIVLPNNISWQRVLTSDGRTLWERSCPWSGSDYTAWGTWQSKTVSSMHITNVTAICTAGTYRCNGNNLEQCDTGELKWNFIRTCPSGCSNNACTVICSPGTRQCSGNILQKCADDGTQWLTDKTCVNGCSNNMCIEDKFTEVINKIKDAINKHEDESKYPFYSQIGYDVNKDGTVDSLQSLDNKYGSTTLDAADWKARLFCAERPTDQPVSDTQPWLEDWARWRKCMSASHTILARYHIFQYLENGYKQTDKDKAIMHIYWSAVHVDAQTTGPEYEVPLSSLTHPAYPDYSTYTLRDTFPTARYLPDGAGIFKMWGIGYHLGLLPQYYCTPLEQPFDAGKTCKTINLWERIRRIAGAIAVKAASEWMIKDNGTVRSEYWDTNRYWANNICIDYETPPNRTFSPNTNIGWYDLVGRRTMGSGSDAGLKDQSMSPHFYNWQMSGMVLNAKLALNGGSHYQTIYDFGLNAVGYTFAFNRTNQAGNYTVTSYLGVPVRGGVSAWCDGTLNLNASDPMNICTGGTAEWYEYGHPENNSKSDQQKGYIYMNQHIAGEMATLNWGQPPSPYSDYALNHYYGFKGTYTKDGDPYYDITTGGFNKATIQKYINTQLAQLGSCDVKKPYCEVYSGLVTNDWGETAGELLLSGLAPVAHIVSYTDPAKAYELLDIASKMGDALYNNPVNTQAMASCNCVDAWGHSGSSTAYLRKAVYINNLLAAYFTFKRYPQPTFPQPPASSAICLDIKYYNLDWSTANTANLRPGNSIYVAVVGDATGFIDQARFRVNSGSWIYTSERKNGTNEFYIQYTFPTEGTAQFRFQVEVHDVVSNSWY